MALCNSQDYTNAVSRNGVQADLWDWEFEDVERWLSKADELAPAALLFAVLHSQTTQLQNVNAFSRLQCQRIPILIVPENEAHCSEHPLWACERIAISLHAPA